MRGYDALFGSSGGLLQLKVGGLRKAQFIGWIILLARVARQTDHAV